MADPIQPAAEAAKAVADAISGPGSPETVKVVQRQDRMSVWIKGLSGPAVSAMLIAFALLASDWVPGLGKQGIWTEATEHIRAQGVTIALIVLAACVGLVLWVAHAGRPSRTEINAGPLVMKIEQGEDE